MKVKYIAAFATASILSVGLGVVFSGSLVGLVQANPVSQSNPCAGVNPCAGANTSTTPSSSTTPSTSAPLSYSDTNGLAIRGADPVAYFAEQKAVLGTSQFEYEWNDATWRFASAQNRALFASNPEAYAPQYGGYCAKAVSEGNLASINPNAWRIVDGKLYLNYSADVQRQWLQDVPGNIAKADVNWPEILVGGIVYQ